MANQEDQNNDKQILALFAQDHSRGQGFEILVGLYHQKVYWLARKMVIDHEDANDITQEVFIKIWQNLEKFKGNSQLFTWIYRIASNQCLEFLRKKRLRYFIPIVDVENLLLQKLDSQDNISGDKIQFLLQKAILSLPEKQRLVFNMRYFDELPYNQISDILGTSEGALKASYHHAVKKIETFMRHNID